MIFTSRFPSLHNLLFSLIHVFVLREAGECTHVPVHRGKKKKEKRKEKVDAARCRLFFDLPTAAVLLLFCCFAVPAVAALPVARRRMTDDGSGNPNGDKKKKLRSTTFCCGQVLHVRALHHRYDMYLLPCLVYTIHM